MRFPPPQPQPRGDTATESLLPPSTSARRRRHCATDAPVASVRTGKGRDRTGRNGKGRNRTGRGPPSPELNSSSQVESSFALDTGSRKVISQNRALANRRQRTGTFRSRKSAARSPRSQSRDVPCCLHRPPPQPYRAPRTAHHPPPAPPVRCVRNLRESKIQLEEFAVHLIRVRAYFLSTSGCLARRVVSDLE